MWYKNNKFYPSVMFSSISNEAVPPLRYHLAFFFIFTLFLKSQDASVSLSSAARRFTSPASWGQGSASMPVRRATSTLAGMRDSAKKPVQSLASSASAELASRECSVTMWNAVETVKHFLFQFLKCSEKVIF